LDPSIKKTEWSREEEEQLLHLAKVMPTQWRSIAPMLHRTATQCLEHYEQLLDAAQRREEERESGTSASASSSSSSSTAQRPGRDDPRRLRPGEIDPLPESRPARPDAVDMDEDETEMLSEARARLANTKGKKAKRKAREKQLEEARRLAVVQKQREMAAAGIDLKSRIVRKGEVDYNAEVAFERRPPPGFFSTRDEDDKARQEQQAERFRPVSLQQLEGKRPEQVEEELRQRDAKRIRLMKEADLPAVFERVNRLNDVDMIAKRTTLQLPKPVLAEEELLTIAKISDKQREEERKMAAESAASHPSTRALLLTPALSTPLLPSYSSSASSLSRATPLITAHRTPLSVDNVGKEAENLLRLMTAQTPLLGGENKSLHPSDWSASTAQPQVIATPKPFTPLLASASSSSSAAAGAATPSSLFANPAPSTPLRDGSSLSAAAPPPLPAAGLTASEAISLQQSSLRQAQREKRQKNHLKQLLSMLPAPKNEVVLTAPAEETLEAEEKDGSAMEEDREEMEAREKRKVSEARDAAWKRQSQAVQRNLPRPASLPSADPEHPPLTPVESLLWKELRAMIASDALNFPPAATADDSSSLKASVINRRNGDDGVTEEALALARSLVEQEAPPLSPSQLSAVASSLPFSPEPLSQSGLAALHSSLSAANGKSSSKLSVLLGGYWSVHGRLRTETAELEQEAARLRRELECYDAMEKREAEGAVSRLRAAVAGLTAVREVERRKQDEYREWSSREQMQTA
jgi:pre-mRNA-splicing factor CDC5/CEF1